MTFPPRVDAPLSLCGSTAVTRPKEGDFLFIASSIHGPRGSKRFTIVQAEKHLVLEMSTENGGKVRSFLGGVGMSTEIRQFCAFSGFSLELVPVEEHAQWMVDLLNSVDYLVRDTTDFTVYRLVRATAPTSS